MTFKRHAMGRIEDRPVHVQFEAKFHQLLCDALVNCAGTGNKKRQGYIMGAFRAALNEFHVVDKKKQAESIQLTAEEVDFLLPLITTMQGAHNDLAITAETFAQREQHHQKAEIASGLKVKLMVRRLMDVEEPENEQAE